MSDLGRVLLYVSTSSTEVSVPALTLSEAKNWIKVEEEDTYDDDLVARLVASAEQRYEAYTNRTLVVKTYDYYPDCVPAFEIVPPKYPLVSVSSIKGFTDTDATDTGGTAMSSSEFYVDVASQPGRIVPFGGYTFPTATRVANPVIVRFSAGYSTATTGIPEDAKTKLGQMVARAYEFRGDQGKQDVAMDECLVDEFSMPEWG